MNKHRYFKQSNAEDTTVYGAHNKVCMVNPYKTYFIAHYSDGSIIEGNDLFNTGWSELPDGISKLQYKLSTGDIITIPKFRGYLATIEVSDGVDGSRIFHSIQVRGMGDSETIKYTIMLKHDNYSEYKIGDILISKEDKIMRSPHWKLAAA